MPLMTGKHPFTPSPKDLKAAKYLDLERIQREVQLPPEFGHEDKMPQPRLILGNGPDDSVAPGFGGAGCCVFSMMANAIRLANALAGKTVHITGKEVIAAYSAVTGYVIGDSSTDNGTDMRTALDWWVKTGFTDADGNVHKLGAYLLIDIKKPQHWFTAFYQLDVGTGLGIAFPDTAMDQFNRGVPWDVVPNMNVEGGHAIMLDAKRKNPKVETWARDQEATEPFLESQVDEAWALLLPEMLVEGKSPEGLDIGQLNADLATLGA